MFENSAPAEAVPETIIPEMLPLPDSELKIDEKTVYEEMFRLVVWDDDYHTMEYVIETFIEYFKLSTDLAFEKTWEIDTYGKSVLDQGSRTDMELHAIVLETKYGLTATVEKDS